MLRSGITCGISILILSLWSCASQTTPTGGPMDTIPPKLIRSKPFHKEKNYTNKTIELTFDEMVNINNPKDEILVSPALEEELEFKVKKNTVVITSPVGWKDSTTYSLSFREGIRDITENNAPENLRLAFSTGQLIDSLIIKGKIKHALKESIPEKITVALYQADTFNIFQHKPSYITVTNKVGSFSLENIKNGTYFIYAFEDKNKNLKVESRTEKFGFLKDSIILNGPLDSLYISLVNLDMRKPTINNYRNNGVYTVVKFNKSIKDYKVTFNEGRTHLINSYGDDQTEVLFYNPKEIVDSLKVMLTASDSIETRIDTTFFIKAVKPNFIPSNFLLKSFPPQYNPGKKEVSIKFQASKPIVAVNYDSIFLQTDSAKYIHFDESTLTYDSINKKITLKKIVEADSLFPDKKLKTQFLLGQGAFISAEGDSSKQLQQVLSPITKAETGTLLIEVKTLEPNYIVLLYNSGGEIIEELKNIKKHTYEYLPAQNYKIRVIIDKNNNGKWDVGNFFKRQSPEPIYFYQTADKKYDFPIRANWELGPIMLIF